MKMSKKIILIFIIIFNVIPMSGCWNYKEINEVAIVAGCAIDRGENKKYLITVEIVNPKPSGPESKIASHVFSQEGDSIFEAIRAMIFKTGRRLYWSHAKVVIVSKDIAKEGVVQIVDWLLRDGETRSEMWLLISEEKTAKEVLDNNPMINEIASFHLDDMMRTNKSTSKFVHLDILEATRELISEGTQTVMPSVSLEKESGKEMASISGTAIFKRDKLIGWLNQIETRAMVRIRGEAKGGLYEVKNALGTGSDIILEIFEENTKRTASISDNRVRFVIDVKMDVGIAEIQGDINVMEKDGLEKLRAQAKEQIKKEIEVVLEKAQKQYQADIFEFSSILQRKMPREWGKIKDDWASVFSEADVHINVDLEIIGSAKISKPIEVKE